MALVDLARTLGVHTLTEQERYIQAHYEKVYLQRRARDQLRHRPRVVMAQVPEPDPVKEAVASPLERIQSLPAKPMTPQRKWQLQDMALRIGAKRRRSPSKQETDRDHESKPG